MAPTPRSTPERLTALEITVQHTHELIEDIHHRLFGNGQPGELYKLEGRVKALEKFRWKLVGIFTACSSFGAAAGVVSGVVLHYLNK